jgi:hypothetical protein
MLKFIKRMKQNKRNKDQLHKNKNCQDTNNNILTIYEKEAKLFPTTKQKYGLKGKGNDEFSD